MSCRTASVAVSDAFHRGFYRWGTFVARNPCSVIWSSVVVALLLSVRLFLSFAGDELPTEVEQDKLWVPQQATAIDEKNQYEAAFARPYRRNTAIFTTKPQGGNVLTQAVLSEVLRFDTLVREDLTARAYDESSLSMGAVGYADLCGRTEADAADNTSATCVGAVTGHGLELWYRSSTGGFDLSFTDAELAAIVDSDRGIDPILFGPGGRTVSVEAIFGGIQRNATGAITGAQAVQLSWPLQGAARETDVGNAVRAFEDQINRLVGSRWTDSDVSDGSASDGSTSWSSSIVEVYPNTEGSTSRELSKAIRGDLAAINIAYLIIFVYATIIFSRGSPTKSKALLAASGIVSVGLAVMVGYGFTTNFVPLNPVVNVLPFILIGIGVDDMFILLFALEEQPEHLDVPTRIGNAMATAGVSITITSLTDLFAFLLGMTSKLPALSGFCTFAAVGILADYAFQITFFAAWMALDVHRQKARKVDCCPCCCAPTEAESACVPCCCCPCTYGCFGAADAKGSSGPPGLRGAIKRYYIPFLRQPWVKATVLVGFAALTGYSIYAASNLRQDFQRRWFVRDDAALQETFDAQDTYYGGGGVGFYVVTPPTTELDYSHIANQEGLFRLEAAVEDNSWTAPESLLAWYTPFRRWVHSCGEPVAIANGSLCIKSVCLADDGSGALAYPYCTHAKHVRDADGVPTGATPVADVKYVVDAGGAPAPPGTPLSSTYVPPSRFWAYLDQFVEDDKIGRLYKSEIIWAAAEAVRSPANVSTGVIATRFRAQYRVAVSASDRVDTMMTMRDSVSGAAFGSSYPYAFPYLFYEQFRIIVGEVITNLCLALLAVILITLLMIVNCLATALVALMIILTDVDILGMMWYWGLSIDSIAAINLVLAIGLALDYSVHIAHAFMRTPGPSRQARVDAALEEMGTPVIHGCASTFLAVVVLSSSSSYVFRVFFRMFFGIVLFGGGHGLILLPVLLSLIGPEYVGGDGGSGAGHGGAHVPEMTLSSPNDIKSASPVAELAAMRATPPSPKATSSAPPSPPESESSGPDAADAALRHGRSLRPSAPIVPLPADPARCEA